LKAKDEIATELKMAVSWDPRGLVEVSAASIMAVYWVVAQCSVVEVQAVRASETSVNSYQTTRRYNPEDNQLHPRRRENLRSHVTGFFSLLHITGLT
jgi:hypothetical protein